MLERIDEKDLNLPVDELCEKYNLTTEEFLVLAYEYKEKILDKKEE